MLAQYHRIRRFRFQPFIGISIDLNSGSKQRDRNIANVSQGLLSIQCTVFERLHGESRFVSCR